MPNDLPQALFGREVLRADLLQPTLKDGNGTLEDTHQQLLFTRTVAIQRDARDAQAFRHGFKRGRLVSLLAKASGGGLQHFLFPKRVFPRAARSCL